MLLRANYLVGMEQRSHLISPFVEHALSQMGNGFNYELKPNEANNCHHTRIHKNRLTLTAHFLGRGKNVRSMPKSAVTRAFLSVRNKDIFDLIENEDSEREVGYCWILHHGLCSPKGAILAIPNLKQTEIVACSELPLPTVSVAEVEEVKEDMIIKLLSPSEEFERENAG